MINGVNLSQIYQVQHTHLNHYQKLNSIINKERNHFSLMSRNLERVVENHKTAHEQWRKHKSKKQDNEIKRDNQAFKKKITSIKMRRSRYTGKEFDSTSTSKGHNFYIRKKRQLSIDVQNPEIANRIINAQGSLSLTRHKIQESQKLVHRLQKFPMMKRMMEFSEKKLLTDGNQIKIEEKAKTNQLHKKYKSQKQCKSLK